MFTNDIQIFCLVRYNYEKTPTIPWLREEILISEMLIYKWVLRYINVVSQSFKIKHFEQLGNNEKNQGIFRPNHLNQKLFFRVSGFTSGFLFSVLFFLLFIFVLCLMVYFSYVSWLSIRDCPFDFHYRLFWLQVVYENGDWCI